MVRMNKCSAKVEVYSRIVGYMRPVAQWNDSKAQEFKDRKVYDAKKITNLNKVGNFVNRTDNEGLHTNTQDD